MGLGNAISSFFNPQRGYNDAAKQMQHYFEIAQSMQEPFRQAGLGQLPILHGAEGALLDPTTLLGKWMEKYETSPFARRSMENARSAGMDAASSMGLSGSSAALGNIEQSASDIMNADRREFLNDLMQKYMTGIGIGQNIFGAGAGAAGELGRGAMQMGGNMGEMAYGRANAPGQRFADLLKLGANTISSIYGMGK